MTKPLSFTLALVLLLPACAVEEHDEVEAQQFDGVWVFTYGETPDIMMEALSTGTASVVDGCLLVEDAVVIWYDHHLDDVEVVVAGVNQGETAKLQVGGGGFSLDEGSGTEEFPPVVMEHCSPTAIWFSNDQAVTIE